MNWLETARKIVDAVLERIPDEEVAVFLSDAAVRRANRAADLAEALKFAGEKR